MLALWVTFTSLTDVFSRLRHRSNRWRALLKLPRHYVGMLLGHIGVAVCATGIAITSAYSVERDVRIEVGQTQQVGPYRFRLDSISNHDGPNYRATEGLIEVREPVADTLVATLRPEKRLYTVQQMPMTEVAILPTLTEDLYVALGEPVGAEAWAVRIHYKPFVRWIWLGGIFMALGGALALSDKRYRVPAPVHSPSGLNLTSEGKQIDVTQA